MRKLALSLLFAIFFVLVSPLANYSLVFAQTCEEQNGHCTPFNCFYGRISGYGTLNCNVISQCCANRPEGGNAFGTAPAPQDCDGGRGFITAIGCIPVEEPQSFASYVLRWGMGIAGGIALGLIGFAGFMIMTSAGNPQKLQAGKELLTAAVSGLILLLFGVFALRFIGVDILQIPGFGT